MTSSSACCRAADRRCCRCPRMDSRSRRSSLVTGSLLRSGATIGEINCVRRHLSRIKGGRLAAACHPARLVTLAISDVPGDGPLDIASGPTVADPTTCADALAVLERYGIEVPSRAAAALRGGEWESVKPGDPRLVRSEYRVVATPQQSLEAAARLAVAHGVTPWIRLGPTRGRGAGPLEWTWLDSWPPSCAKGGRYDPHACCCRGERPR